MNAIGEKIKYLPSSEYPLSADVYFIEGDKYCYIYDVGNNDDSLNQINQIALFNNSVDDYTAKQP